MAKQTVVQFIDDIDGKDLKEAVTIEFGVDGKSYEFDTSSVHAKEFRKSLEKYIAASRRAGRNKGHASMAGGKRPKEQTQAIRDWARQNGYDVSDRGRIPLEIAEAFDAAH
ncbi:Lsr2 family protein [Gordonia sp. CPCC 205515]|uniref:histone-like nucleoid-structuring protein Lsr2 n=1 Tax=Gordonia sp. CPCC 205515 TaxID=3140791 RepID=UPI003AF39506